MPLFSFALIAWLVAFVRFDFVTQNRKKRLYVASSSGALIQMNYHDRKIEVGNMLAEAWALRSLSVPGQF